MIDTASVLYVDDRRGKARAAALERAGLTVVPAESAFDGIKRLDDERIDCVVVRADLPDVSLPGFVRCVRGTDPSVPIVLVGGGDAPEHVSRALEAGATGYVLDDDGLTERVLDAVADRRAERVLRDHTRLKDIVRDVTLGLLDAGDRTAVERVVYDRLATSDLYGFVWVGEYDSRADVLALHMPVRGEFRPDAVGALVGDNDPEFVRRAVENCEISVTSGAVDVRSAAAASPADAGEFGATADGAGGTTLSSAALPLARGGAVQGVVLLSTDRRGAFDESERDLLGELGEIVAHALRSGGFGDGDVTAERVKEFAELFAHELRNPLGIATTHLEIGRESGDSDAYDRVETALSQLEETIDSVLSVARRGGIEGTTDRDLGEAADAAWKRIGAEDAELVISDSMTVPADQELLARLLVNLFRNAVDHGGDGVTVRVGTIDDGFYVEDDGPGVPAEDRDRVFEWGFSSTEGGSGIGLSVVREIVDAHGWEIGVAEGARGGARFEITGVTP